MYEITNFVGSLASAIKTKTEKFIVLDVEGYSTARPYNVGYIIADKYGTIYLKRSFALPACIWENIVSMMSSRQAEEMTKANVEEILQDVEKPRVSRKYKISSVDYFKKRFAKDVERFKVKRLFAYNVNFDKGSLRRLFGETEFQKLNLEYCDIISGIVQTRLTTEKYIRFCIDNGYVTEKGNIQTKAEIVYRYLTNSKDFVEEHTGLADCLIEYEILLTAFNAHKKINWKPCVAWRILKNHAIEKGIAL